MNLLSRIEKLEARLTNDVGSKHTAAVWLYEGPEGVRTYWRAGSSTRLSEEQFKAESQNTGVHILLPDNGRETRLYRKAH